MNEHLKCSHISEIWENFASKKSTLFIDNSVAMYKAQLLNQAAFFWSTHQTHGKSAQGTFSLWCKTLNCADSYFAHEILTGNSKCSYRHPVPNSSNWLSQCCSVWLDKTSKIRCKAMSLSYLKRVFSSRSAGGSSVINVTSSCIQ